MNTTLLLILFCLGLGLFALFALVALRSRFTVQHAANSGTHMQLTRFAEEAVGIRNLLFIQGTAANQVLIADGVARPIGIMPDTVDADNLEDEPKAIELLGIAPRTLPMVASEAIGIDVDVFSVGAAGKIGVLPAAAGTYWKVGRSVTAGDGDGSAVEVAHHAPVAVVVEA